MTTETQTESDLNRDPVKVRCYGPRCTRTLDPLRETVYPDLDQHYWCPACWQAMQQREDEQDG